MKENVVIPSFGGESGVFWDKYQIAEFMVKSLNDDDYFELLQINSASEMAGCFHMTIGRWIRNTFALWDAKNPFTQNKHPDDYSSEILELIWSILWRREVIGL